MHARNAYFFARRKRDKTATREWIFVLRNLISLWQIWVKIIFAVKLAFIGNLCAERKSYRNNFANRIFVGDRKRSWMREAHRAYIFVWLCFICIVFTTAKHLARSGKLRVYFKTDNGLILHILS